MPIQKKESLQVTDVGKNWKIKTSHRFNDHVFLVIAGTPFTSFCCWRTQLTAVLRLFNQEKLCLCVYINQVINISIEVLKKLNGLNSVRNFTNEAKLRLNHRSFELVAVADSKMCLLRSNWLVLLSPPYFIYSYQPH